MIAVCKVRAGKQAGFATILTVVSLSIVLVTALLTVYIYVVNRARHYARIKESYKLINVMEEAAKTVRSAWDNAAAAQAANIGSGPPLYTGASPCVTNGPTTDQCAQAIAAQTYNYIPNCGKAGHPACCQYCPGATVADLCFDNVDNTTTPYCFYGLSGLANYTNAQYKVPSPKISPKSLPTDVVNKFYARLDMFFEGINLTNPTSTKDEALKAPTLVGWFLNEKKAWATGSYSAPNTATLAPDTTNNLAVNSVSCGGAGGGAGAGSVGGITCIACGTGTGRQCAAITACPSTFSQCANWDPTTQAPLFAQEFTERLPEFAG